MASYNKVILIGNLTRDPEVRYTPSQTAVADLDMAINRRYKKSNGEFGEETCYVNKITVWGSQAENCGKYLKRGAPVLVEGRLKYETWEKDGQKQSRLGVIAERVQFLSGPSSQRTEFQDGARAAQPAAPAAPTPAPPVAPPPVASPEVAPAAPASDDLTKDDEDLPF
jgi:single-strand DNA-binding protein